MVFDTGKHTFEKDAGPIRGTEEAIACDCWFKSTGGTIPRMIKYKDASGEIHTINHIIVHCTEEKYYCGIKTLEYRCSVIHSNQKLTFLLIFHVEECQWRIIWQ